MKNLKKGLDCDRCELSRCCVMCCQITNLDSCTTSCDKEMTQDFLKRIIETRSLREQRGDITQFHKEMRKRS